MDIQQKNIFSRYNFVIYSRLLRRYLEHKYKNVKKANQKYSNLTKMVDNLEQMKENDRIMFARMDSTQIPEICVELFDL